MASYGWVSRIFRRRAFAEDTVEEAVKAQLQFEAAHPIPYAPDQRRTAIMQRCRLKGGTDKLFSSLVDAALKVIAARIEK